MQQKYLWRRILLVWATGLLFASLLGVSACGGAADSEAEQSADTEPTQEVASAVVEEQEEAAEPIKETETTPEEALTEDENAEEPALSAPVTVAECTTVDIPDDTAVTPASDNDWALGDSSAALTLIEYGDFQ